MVAQSRRLPRTTWPSFGRASRRRHRSVVLMTPAAPADRPASRPCIVRLRRSSWSIAAFALECRRRLAGFHHHGRGLAAATALSHEFRRQLHDRLLSRLQGLNALGPELGFGERSTPVFHSSRAILAPFCSARPCLPLRQPSRQETARLGSPAPPAPGSA